MDDYTAKQKEAGYKRLLFLETVITVIATSFLLALIFAVDFFRISDGLKIAVIAVGFIAFFIAILFAIRIEQIAGYYECRHCKHRYVPTFKAVNMAMHMGRTRYMKCPKCGKKSWQKKVINKE